MIYYLATNGKCRELRILSMKFSWIFMTKRLNLSLHWIDRILSRFMAQMVQESRRS